MAYGCPSSTTHVTGIHYVPDDKAPRRLARLTLATERAILFARTHLPFGMINDPARRHCS
jgi:hypothetical protein